jgi:hypothetical protein
MEGKPKLLFIQVILLKHNTWSKYFTVTCIKQNITIMCYVWPMLPV